ncbi:MAG: hypothetical protein LRY73_07380 [Bacillus sp. (in: Bacteria)]|nr:hypothetical protein [Bacillus sp. (in: firmicutes)]
MKVPFYLQWWAIILGFIVFWPIGILLLILRITRSRRLMLKAGNGIRIVGILILAFFGLLTIGVIVDPEVGLEVFFVFCLFFLLPGLFLYRYGRKLRLESSKTKKYIQLVVNEHLRSVDDIARSLQANPTKVREDLRKLIDQDFLPNATLNHTTDRLEIMIADETIAGQDGEGTEKDNRGKTTTSANVASKTGGPHRPVSVTCPGCGANNIIMGSTGECEYCGSTLTT